MLREIKELGFEYAELSHGIRLSLMPGILDAVKAGEIKISTLHPRFLTPRLCVYRTKPKLDFTQEKPILRPPNYAGPAQWP